MSEHELEGFLAGVRSETEAPITDETCWVRVALLPRDRYKVVEAEDGWEVLALDDRGAFS